LMWITPFFVDTFFIKSFNSQVAEIERFYLSIPLA
jgi:hypothetical protein